MELDDLAEEEGKGWEWLGMVRGTESDINSGLTFMQGACSYSLLLPPLSHLLI